MKNIILVGMPGCGKSTVGVVLAKTLGMRFVDTDLIIQQEQHEVLHKLIERYGLKRFSEMEEEALLSVTDTEDTVIATGFDSRNSRLFGESSAIEAARFAASFEVQNMWPIVRAMLR